MVAMSSDEEGGENGNYEKVVDLKMNHGVMEQRSESGD